MVNTTAALDRARAETDPSAQVGAIVGLMAATMIEMAAGTGSCRTSATGSIRSSGARARVPHPNGPVVQPAGQPAVWQRSKGQHPVHVPL